MKGLTKIVTASAVGLSLSVSAMAADGIQNNISSINQSASDLSYAFANSENLQVKTIPSQEMEATEGALVANAVGGVAGGLGGHFGYMGQAAFTKDYSFRSHMASVGVGAGAGAFNPVAGVGSAAASFGVGIATGAANTWASKGTSIKTTAQPPQSPRR